MDKSGFNPYSPGFSIYLIEDILYPKIVEVIKTELVIGKEYNHKVFGKTVVKDIYKIQNRNVVEIFAGKEVKVLDLKIGERFLIA